MFLRVPHYYKDFKCTASACKDNCCIGGWEIDIDTETAQYYLSIEGDFGNRLRDSISHQEEYCFKLKDGRCPFLDNRNLCEIYQQLGEERMGVVCAQFPRFTEYFGNAKERGIGLACEEAARIILSDRQPFNLEETQIDEEIVEDSEYDAELAEALMVYRQKLIALIETDIFTLNEKLSFMLESSYELQELINSNCYRDVMDYAEKLDFEAYKSFEGYKESSAETFVSFDFNAEEGIMRILSAYLELEAINEDWSDIIHEQFYMLENISDYGALSSEFGSAIADRAYEYNNIIKYYIFRYVLKAAYDHSLYEKIQLITANYIVLHQMEFSKWLKNGRTFSVSDRMEIIHIFSREVEYSEDNLWALAEEFLFDDIFQKDALIFLLKIC